MQFNHNFNFKEKASSSKNKLFQMWERPQISIEPNYEQPQISLELNDEQPQISLELNDERPQISIEPNYERPQISIEFREDKSKLPSSRRGNPNVPNNPVFKQDIIRFQDNCLVDKRLDSFLNCFSEMVKYNHRDSRTFEFMRKIGDLEDLFIESYDNYRKKYYRYLYMNNLQKTQNLVQKFLFLADKADSQGYNAIFYEKVLNIIISLC